VKLSAAARRDPMHAARIAKQYERKILRLFRDYRRLALESLDVARENEAVRELEPTPIRIAWIVDALDLLAREKILAPGEVVVTEGVRTGYHQGVLYAERALARIGISSQLGRGPADQQVLDVLQARNLSALKGITAETNKSIIRSLTEGINNGEGVVKLRERLMAEVEGIGYNRARLMAHTETMYASNEGAKLRYSQHGVTRVEWLTAGHDNTCADCAALNGQVFDIDKTPPIPLHPNCLLPGTFCETAGDIVAGLRARYEGPVVELTIANGRQITVTPNHMFLTPQGFAAAQSLRKGDNVIYRTGFEGVVSGNPDDYKGPSRIEDIFSALTKSRGMATIRVPLAAEDLHGDGRLCDGDIDVILPDCFLWDAVKPSMPQHISCTGLYPTARPASLLDSQSPVAQFLVAAARASDGGMSGTRQPSPFFRGRVPHPDIHRLTPPAGCDAVLSEDTGDDVPGDAVLFGDGFDRSACLERRHDCGVVERYPPVAETNPSLPESAVNSVVSDVQQLRNLLTSHPGFVEVLDVVDVKIRYFSGHVYDLQTQSTLYFGNGVLVSNCRCTLLPVIE
jgi:SPP1 gp7 family putative phage head morphogenesis protein